MVRRVAGLVADASAQRPRRCSRSRASVCLCLPCYYYRKAYYRSFVGSPPGCAVPPITRRGYRGETALLLFQNLHRYAMYFALVYLPILSYDALISVLARRPVRHGVGSSVI